MILYFRTTDGSTSSTTTTIQDVLERGYTIYGEFNCNDSYKYPLSLCTPNVGLEVYGNYELQLNRKDKNNHPICIRNGYSIYGGYVTTYLYLHNGNLSFLCFDFIFSIPCI